MSTTAPIKGLVLDALDRLPRPLTDDVIDDAFFVVETTPELRSRYDSLCSSRGKKVVNTWGGYWIANAVERRGRIEVKAQKSTLIGQYSKLDQPAPPKPSSRKTQVEDAGKEVFDYYLPRKNSLPPDIVNMRDEITEMVADGMPVAEAFATAIDLLSVAGSAGL